MDSSREVWPWSYIHKTNQFNGLQEFNVLDRGCNLSWTGEGAGGLRSGSLI